MPKPAGAARSATRVTGAALLGAALLSVVLASGVAAAAERERGFFDLYGGGVDCSSPLSPMRSSPTPWGAWARAPACGSVNAGH